MTECHVVSWTGSWSRKRVCWGKLVTLQRGVELIHGANARGPVTCCHFLGLRRGHGTPTGAGPCVPGLRERSALPLLLSVTLK